MRVGAHAAGEQASGGGEDHLIQMEGTEESYEPFGWGDIPSEMWLSQDDAYSYTLLQ